MNLLPTPRAARTGLLWAGLILLPAALHAATVTSTLGNAAHGFDDGSKPTTPELAAAQSGQPAPFNVGIGNEVLGPDFDANWTHNFAPVDLAVDKITTATLTLGIADHDSFAAGSQLSVFDIETFDLKSELDGLFEAGGGSHDGVYNTYTLNLSGALLEQFTDGSVDITLTLQGPGLQTQLPFLGGNEVESGNNGAHLLFSTLELTVVPVPLPAPVALLAVGLLGVLRSRRGAAVVRHSV